MSGIERASARERHHYRHEAPPLRDAPPRAEPEAGDERAGAPQPGLAWPLKLWVALAILAATAGALIAIVALFIGSIVR